jgi:hypothetical protein
MAEEQRPDQDQGTSNTTLGLGGGAAAESSHER